MRWGLLLLLGAWSAAGADEVSFVNEGVVDAPVEEVWKIFATSEGYKVLGPALADVDLRIGGTIRSRYGADGTLGDAETIENTILAYEPPTMMATSIAKTPATFPFKSAWKSTWTVVTLVPVERGKTLLRASSLGFGSDEESVAMRRFFEAGNQSVIASVQRHFAQRSNP
ncbi:MAG TPA: SRPBCC domain-containing protein [Gammaproteobacteria bacterium]|nr:SRPBCC domain-containing protein [Gammaproteobacteria bacterium]